MVRSAQGGVKIMLFKFLNKSVLAVAIVSVALPALIVFPDAANAQSSGRKGADVRSGTTGGYCPAGTCSKNGGKYARDVANCSAANCRR